LELHILNVSTGKQEVLELQSNHLLILDVQ